MPSGTLSNQEWPYVSLSDRSAGVERAILLLGKRFYTYYDSRVLILADSSPPLPGEEEAIAVVEAAGWLVTTAQEFVLCGGEHSPPWWRHVGRRATGGPPCQCP